jgi:hypothetical protein
MAPSAQSMLRRKGSARKEGRIEHDWEDVSRSLHVMSFRVTPLCGLLLQAAKTGKFSSNFHQS